MNWPDLINDYVWGKKGFVLPHFLLISYNLCNHRTVWMLLFWRSLFHPVKRHRLFWLRPMSAQLESFWVRRKGLSPHCHFCLIFHGLYIYRIVLTSTFQNSFLHSLNHRHSFNWGQFLPSWSHFWGGKKVCPHTIIFALFFTFFISTEFFKCLLSRTLSHIPQIATVLLIKVGWSMRHTLHISHILSPVRQWLVWLWPMHRDIMVILALYGPIVLFSTSSWPHWVAMAHPFHPYLACHSRVNDMDMVPALFLHCIDV